MTISSDDPDEPNFNVGVQGEAIPAPEIAVSPDSIGQSLDYGDSVDVPLQIANNGGSALDWSAEAMQSQAALEEIDKSVTPPENSKLDFPKQRPSQRPSHYLVSEAPFDLQFSFDLQAASGDLGNAGAEFDGQYYYTTRWASNLIHCYDQNGNLVKEFSIPGVSGLRDLAWDGQYMYGGAAANTIYQMDFDTEVLVGTLSSPVPVRHIAYDQGADGFWVGNWDTDIVLVDRSGNTVNTIPVSSHGFGSMYGSAYDGWSAGGPYLWVFDQGNGQGFPQFMHQIDLSSGTTTGFTYDVASDFASVNGIAGGLFTAEGIVSNTVSIGGVLQGTPDMFFVYELTESGSAFMRLLPPTSGTITPGNSTNLTVRLYGVEGDTTFSGSIVINSNDPVNPVTIIPVSLEVGPVGIGDLEALPTTYDVSRNYPNPFNPTTTINYQLPKADDVKLVIYNVLGQRVRTLVNGRVEPGRYKVVWNGRNEAGVQVSSGIYIYRFEAGDFRRVHKMIMLK